MFATILRGSKFGDESKGTVIDYLAREFGIKTVIRDNGGPQAGHRVVDPTERWHVFSQFGSATLIPGTVTYLSNGMLVQPINLLRENKALKSKGVTDAMQRIFIDPDCAIVTPLHKLVGRMLEISRGENRFGSVGMGVGQAVLDREAGNGKALVFRDVFDEAKLEEKLARHISEKFSQARRILEINGGNDDLREIYRDYEYWITLKRLFASYAMFGTRFNYLFREKSDFFGSLEDGEDVIFEGAQGTLLNAFPPYVTKTLATAATAEALIRRYLPKAKVRKIGAMRAYDTRHGAGPFVTEIQRLSELLADIRNRTHPWQGKFRVGWFDVLSANLAIEMNRGIDTVALTNLDRMSQFAEIPVCTAYEYCGNREDILDDFFEWRWKGKTCLLEKFRPPDKQADRSELAKVLFDCRPADYRIMDGWKRDISNVRSFDGLPREAKEYVRFLESDEGFNVPISVVSVGERSDQKFMIYDPYS